MHPSKKHSRQAYFNLDYRGQTTLFDPMCGSGTIAIEAAYIALNKASQIHRASDFSFSY